VPLTSLVPAGDSPQVLVADDHEIHRTLLRTLLQRQRISVHEAVDGRDAVQLATRTRYDLIFIDCEMPVLDGYRAAIQIRQLPEPWRSVPILALTAGTGDCDLVAQQTCIAAGMTDRICKPITSSLLARILGVYLNHHVTNTTPPRAEPVAADPLHRLRHRVGDDDELIGLLLTQFDRDSPTIQASIVQAVNQGDLTTARRQAHQLRGILMSLGASDVADAAHDLEALDKNTDQERITTVRDRLELMMGRLRWQLRLAYERSYASETHDEGARPAEQI
jgi:CheY-like chemotaxis protein/HPt (histidine-containing phosphotransfer) domain-containing protein